MTPEKIIYFKIVPNFLKNLEILEKWKIVCEKVMFSSTVESRISKLLSSEKTLISKQELLQAWITLYHKSHAE